MCWMAAACAALAWGPVSPFFGPPLLYADRAFFRFGQFYPSCSCIGRLNSKPPAGARPSPWRRWANNEQNTFSFAKIKRRPFWIRPPGAYLIQKVPHTATTPIATAFKLQNLC